MGWCRWYEDRGAWIDKKPALGTLLLERVTKAQVKSGGVLEVIAPRSGSTEPYTLAADDGSAARNDTTAREWVHQIKEAKKEARRLASQQQTVKSAGAAGKTAAAFAQALQQPDRPSMVRSRPCCGTCSFAALVLTRLAVQAQKLSRRVMTPIREGGTPPATPDHGAPRQHAQEDPAARRAALHRAAFSAGVGEVGAGQVELVPDDGSSSGSGSGSGSSDDEGDTSGMSIDT